MIRGRSLFSPEEVDVVDLDDPDMHDWAGVQVVIAEAVLKKECVDAASTQADEAESASDRTRGL